MSAALAIPPVPAGGRSALSALYLAALASRVRTMASALFADSSINCVNGLRGGFAAVAAVRISVTNEYYRPEAAGHRKGKRTFNIST